MLSGWIFAVVVLGSPGALCGIETAQSGIPWPTREACEAVRALVAHGMEEDGPITVTPACWRITWPTR